MDLTSVAFALLGAVAVLLVGLAYRRIWGRLDSRGRVPSGFGALLAPAMLVGAWWSGAPKEMVLALAAATAGTLVYWIDDAKEMSARVRLIVAAITGCVIGASYFLAADFPILSVIVLLALAAFVHVSLVNTINMQDGADLNIATFVILTAVLLLIYGGESQWTAVAVACLVFTVPFSLLNFRPRSLYFGDSGCFAFAALFTIMGVAFLTGEAPPPEAAIPAGLPLVDMVFVTAHRIRLRQKFTVRHYFHLYQRLQTCQPGFAYLAPQLVSVAVALALATGLQAFGLDRLSSVVVAIMAASLATFWIGRRLFVSGEPGPPPQRAPL